VERMMRVWCGCMRSGRAWRWGCATAVGESRFLEGKVSDAYLAT
jgi:hypothetical protein